MPRAITIPDDESEVELTLAGKRVKLTNLDKLFWRESGITKRQLLQYYADVSPALLPHLRDRAMVMKRYPNGAKGKCFFMKRVPEPHPAWIETCTIDHKSGNVIDFPMVQDLASLLWIVNLGCIDLNQWYARCDDVLRPDFLHFDLDPAEGATFEQACECSLIVRDALTSLGMKPYVKTTGSRGLHVYVALKRGPLQETVHSFAKALATELASRNPKLMSVGYRVAARPKGRVVVDYKQNAWGQTLASIYSVRPKPLATVSTPVTWKEVEKGIRIEDFRIDNVRQRVNELGDLWKPLLAARERTNLDRFFKRK